MATKGIKGFDIKGLKEVYKNLELAEEEIPKEQYYLYGIDRDNLLHIFDINNRR